MLTPIEFGLPPKYREWRPDQLRAVDQMLETDERFVTLCAPTGFGKSLAYMAAARMGGKRSVICTSTKGLQDQLRVDFSGMSVDIRGQGNYPCVAAKDFGIFTPITVEMGPCHGGEDCKLKANGCEYYDRYRLAQRSEIVVTNYALWMTDRLRETASRLNAVKPVEMLVLDEAHDAPDALAGHLATELMYKDCREVGIEWPGETDEQEKWKGWAGEAADKLEGMIEAGQAEIRSKRGDTHSLVRKVMKWKAIQRKVERIATMKGEWVIEAQRKDNWRVRKYGPIVQFDPLWPAPYAEPVLFRGAKKVILVSATVRPKTAQLLGITSKENNFLEYPSQFPVQSRPVIHVPTVQMKYNMTEWATLQWIGKIDRILEARGNKKGIIHTVSYDRAKLIQLNSQYASRMISHDSNDRAQIVSSFKSSSKPLILVSPSVDTGYDFPYRECEFQIIAKIPFVDGRGKLVKARTKSDPQYGNYMVAQTVEQMVGRGMRAVDDRCETLIVDDNFEWFFRNNRQHFTKSFCVAVKWLGDGQIPIPLEELK